MKAIVYEKSIPRFLALKALGARRTAQWSAAGWNALCPVSAREISEKPLPTEEWVRVAPRLSGICGSDLSVICAKGSPYFSPLTSAPFVLGHEVVGTITHLGRDVARCEEADGLAPLSLGDRVILEPALGCRVRGIRPLCAACARRQSALCRNVTRGDISAGIQTGYCRDTGGGWSSNFVAHRSQLFGVPESVSDAAAVLAEPLACVLHGVLRAMPTGDQTALVVGCGSIGLLTIAALRMRGCEARIVAVARHAHQRRQASALGADVVIAAMRHKRKRSCYDEWAATLDAELYFPELGKPTVVGGADVTYDCIGSSDSLDDSIRFTTAGGSTVLIGMPGMPSGIDWTAIWYKELSIYAAYAYGLEKTNGSAAGDGEGVPTCALAIEALETWADRLVELVGEPFELADYRRAIRAAMFTGQSGAIKTVFRIST